MPSDLKELRASAVALPAKERGELTARLLASLEEEAEEVDLAAVERAWIDEVNRRRSRLLAGETATVPAEEALARVGAKLRTRMPAEAEEIATEALGLPADQRRRLAQRLLASLEEHADAVDVEAVERAWIAEAERRFERYLAGETKAVPLEEALARLRARPRQV